MCEILPRSRVRCIGSRNVYRLQSAQTPPHGGPRNVSGRTVGHCVEKIISFVFVCGERGNKWIGKDEGEGRGKGGEGAGPERSGGGRSETRTVYNPLSFSTRRPPPYPSLPPNLPKWRRESQLTPSNQLASLTTFLPPGSSVSCNFRTVGRARPQASLAAVSRFQSYVPGA